MNMNKKPYIICHMVQSIDGRIDCHMVDHICGDEYDEIRESYKAPSFVNGRVTMEKYWAEKKRFASKTVTKIKKPLAFCAVSATGYAFCVDTNGVLRYKSNLVEDKPLVVVTSEKASKEYLDYLKSKMIGYIAVGRKEVDLVRAMELLYSEFGVKRLMLLGGGIINGAFLKSGLIDEFSIIIGNGIDGRAGFVGSFDGLEAKMKAPFKVKLVSVKSYKNGSVWLRYKK